LAVAKKTSGKIHVVGHSYGAALALEAARVLGDRVKSLTLVEPVSFHLLRIEDRPEWKDVEKLGVSVLEPVAKGDDRKAAAAFMSYWLGRWRWWLSPERFKKAITATIPKVALEFTIAIDTQTTLADYAEIQAPALLIVGSKTPPPTRAVIELLAGALPNASVETLIGAGHMSPFTHPAELNRLILDHLAAER
jgi:pimeloyl-ACP methyl ester carboxylesterase